MFVLALLKQTVRVPADKFKGLKENQGFDVDVAIKLQLNKKFANKVRNKAFFYRCYLIIKFLH
jgi:DNA-directed RNA polymerase subunit E'/Rpb7